MNARFFDVKKSKQDAIINAALKIFMQNGYKKASTDVIVKEAGISKGLLFHYFISKKGLYEFICDYSVKYMTLELSRAVNKSEKDFFKVQVQVERAKTRVMKNYPYMQQFLNNMKFEKNPDALEAIGDKCELLEETYNQIYCQTDNTRFLDKIDINKIIDMIGWMSDGFIRDKFQNSKPDLDAMNEEFEKYLSMLRRHFYRSANDELISIARDEMVERDDSVMEQMRQKAEFEERLIVGGMSVKDETVENAKENAAAEAEPVNETIETDVQPKVEKPAKASKKTKSAKTEKQDAKADSVAAVTESDAEESEDIDSAAVVAQSDKPSVIDISEISVSSAAIPVANTPIKLWSEPVKEKEQDEPADSIEENSSQEDMADSTIETTSESKISLFNEVLEAAKVDIESSTGDMTDEKPEPEVKAEKTDKIDKEILTDESEETAAEIETETETGTEAGAEEVSGDNDDLISFPAWWTDASADAQMDAASDSGSTFAQYAALSELENETSDSDAAQTDTTADDAEYEQDTVTFNIPSMQPVEGQAFGHYIDDALEMDMNYSAYNTGAVPGAGAMTIPAAADPSQQLASMPQFSTPVMAEMPVPDEILKTTYNNVEDDDDEPWTPRPVKQIRL